VVIHIRFSLGIVILNVDATVNVVIMDSVGDEVFNKNFLYNVHMMGDLSY